LKRAMNTLQARQFAPRARGQDAVRQEETKVEGSPKEAPEQAEDTTRAHPSPPPSPSWPFRFRLALGLSILILLLLIIQLIQPCGSKRPVDIPRVSGRLLRILQEDGGGGLCEQRGLLARRPVAGRRRGE